MVQANQRFPWAAVPVLLLPLQVVSGSLAPEGFLDGLARIDHRLSTAPADEGGTAGKHEIRISKFETNPKSRMTEIPNPPHRPGLVIACLSLPPVSGACPGPMGGSDRRRAIVIVLRRRLRIEGRDMTDGRG